MKIGCDIVQISRIEKLKTKPRFYSYFFTEAEYAYLEQNHFSDQTIAGILAAKEACVKGFKVGFGKELNIRDIEVLHRGRVPYINVENPKLKAFMQSYGAKAIDLSISHDGDYAIAQALIENI